METLNSLVEGQFPEKPVSAVSSLPLILMSKFHFGLLDECMQYAWQFQRKIVLPNEQKRALDKWRGNPNQRDFFQWRAINEVEAASAHDFISGSIILTRIIAAYAEPTSLTRKILQKKQWTEWASTNIGSIEILSDKGELERVRNLM